MKSVSVDDTSTAYSCSLSCELEVYTTTHQLFWEFCVALRQFTRTLGEQAGDEDWRRFLRPLKRYRFELSAAPLAFNHSAVAKATDLQQLHQELLYCEDSYPSYLSKASDLVRRYKELTQL